ncbi:hypothetical protein F5Y00DRAFT_258425 [Daldinia vernicosa]|uniref:uncharacterized protein n=1 Tax=Daldinia vernicosa TaxID=114800 RepID=UPI0020077F1C|nr:uncharacterized protein F5Y00DRAFT_258425 [Daldinia vernicosa]KAI0852579.1 hypothetical protein F5Y00DRAFT_258425 [Daldinia vernicosa]
MGNCMSTCGGRRKMLVPPGFEMVTLSGIEGTTQEPQEPQRNSPDLTTLPIGIALTTDEVVAAPSPIVNATTSNQALGGSTPRVDGDSHSLTESLKDVTINDIQVETARPVNYSRPGAHRLVASTSAYNIRDLRETSCGNVPPPRLRPSATMGNLNKPLPKYPNDDPVAAYIAQENMKLEETWKKLFPEKAFLVDFNRERHMTRPRALRESIKSTSSNDEKNDAKDDPPVDGDDTNTGPAEEINEDSGTGATQEAGGDSENPKDLIRILRQKILQLDDMLSQLGAEEASKPIPSLVTSDANDPGNPTTPSPIRRSNILASTVAGTSDTGEPSTQENKMDMGPSDFVESPHSTGRPRRPRPVGIIGPSTPTRTPDQPSGLYYEAHSRDGLDAETEQPSMVSEAGSSQIVVRDTLPQVPSSDEERDYYLYESLYEVALEVVTKNYHEAKPVILAKVRRFVASERTVYRVVETILAMTDDVIDTCVNDEDSLEIVQMMVTGSCQGSELVPNGKMTPTFQEELDKEAEATKVRKAIALLEKWAAEAKAKEEADEEAKEKGKGKENAE